MEPGPNGEFDPDPRPPRTLEEIKLAMKSGQTVLTPEETTVYFNSQEHELVEKERQTEADAKFWEKFSRVTTSFPFKLLDLYGYALFSLIPLAGIVIGIIYVAPEHCPAEPSIAPVMIALGFLSLIIGVTSWIRGRRKIVIAGSSAGAEIDEEAAAGVDIELTPETATSPNPKPATDENISES